MGDYCAAVLTADLIFADAGTSKVGIGTATPGTKLDVRGDAVFNDDEGNNNFRVAGETDSFLLNTRANGNTVGVGVSNVGEQEGKLSISAGTADATPHTDLAFESGAVGESLIRNVTNASVGTTAEKIIPGAQKSQISYIAGRKTGGGTFKEFFDVVIWGQADGAVSVESSVDIVGGPASRTYFLSNGELFLAMGSDTYKVRTTNLLIGLG